MSIGRRSEKQFPRREGGKNVSLTKESGKVGISKNCAIRPERSLCRGGIRGKIRICVKKRPIVSGDQREIQKKKAPAYEMRPISCGPKRTNRLALTGGRRGGEEKEMFKKRAFKKNSLNVNKSNASQKPKGGQKMNSGRKEKRRQSGRKSL